MAKAETKIIKIAGDSGSVLRTLQTLFPYLLGLHAKNAFRRSSIRKFLEIVTSDLLRIADVAKQLSLSVGIPGLRAK
jgi:hypothetical protein